MASKLSLQAGPLTASVDFKGTDAQFQSALTDYMVMNGIDMSGTNQQRLQRVVDYIWLENIVRIRTYRKNKLMAEQTVALEAQLNTDLPL